MVVDCIFFFNKRLKKELVHKNALAGKQVGRIARDSGLFRVDCKACNWCKIALYGALNKCGALRNYIMCVSMI